VNGMIVGKSDRYFYLLYLGFPWKLLFTSMTFKKTLIFGCFFILIFTKLGIMQFYFKLKWTTFSLLKFRHSYLSQ
jgi:hypothetical protein